MMAKIYSVLGSMFLGFYGLSAYNGWELPGESSRIKVSEHERRQPGWHRSPTIWYSGYRGGK